MSSKNSIFIAFFVRIYYNISENMIHFTLTLRMLLVKADLPKRRDTMNESEILRLMREAPHEGHRALFDAYYNYVSAIVTRILRNTGTKEDIDECIIDVFTNVIRHLDTGTESSLKAYIGTTAKHKAISLRRSLTAKTGRNVPMDDELAASLSSGEDIAGQAERAAVTERLLKEIAALGEPDSTIIIQKYFYSRKSGEIAQMVGLLPAAVRLRCSRALKKLRERLRDIS